MQFSEAEGNVTFLEAGEDFFRGGGSNFFWIRQGEFKIATQKIILKMIFVQSEISFLNISPYSKPF